MPHKSRSTGVRAVTGFFLVLLVLGLSSSGTGRTAAVAGTAPADDPGKRKPGASSSAASSGASGDWMSRAQRRIEDSEYEMSWQERPLVPALGPSWHAPNRAHGFRTYFTDDGLRLIPRQGEPPSWQFGLRLSGVGRADTLLPAARAVRTPAANRITYDRGDVVEWYVNDRRGLEQGFTLSAPPESDQDWPAPDDDSAVAGPSDEPLLLAFILEGDLSPIVSTDGQAIDFVTAAGARVLRYAQLQVTDANGTRLPARMEGWSGAGARGIRLVVEDQEAVWPITIDPLLTSPAWTAEGDEAQARFGFSVGTAGDVNGDGYSDVIVGAPFYDNGVTDQGRVYVYHGSASGLSMTADWTAESNQAGTQFGRSVGTAGDVNGDGYAEVIVGALLFDNDQTNDGGAFVWYGSASGLGPNGTPLNADWTAESDQAESRFGASVGTAGDVNGDGYSDVIVGGYLYDNDQIDEGRAWVYHGSGSGLSPTANWMAEGDLPSATLGWSVGTAGDVNGDGYTDVIVGASGVDNGFADEGRALVYLGSGTGLQSTAVWTAEGEQATVFFGTWVGTAGDVNGDGYADVIVGSELFDNGQIDEGQAWVYYGSSTAPFLSTTADWMAEGDQAGARFGVSVATAGDVNGDGYADVVVGAYLYDLDPNTVVDPNNVVDSGRAFVYHGSASGLGPNGTPGNADWTADINQAGAQFGFIRTAGDVNGDGYSDVIVGASSFDNPETNEGRAYVYLGSPSGPETTAGWTGGSNQAGAQFGYSVGTAGDVNGDGFSDVIVGAPFFDNGQAFEGSALVYHGSASGLSLASSWTAGSNQASAFFGSSVGTAGDVNGDGFSDVIVGAVGFDNDQTDEGRVFVYLGSPSGTETTAGWTAESDQQSAYFGSSVGTAGDVNGDGFSDVIVGAYGFTNGQTSEGRAFVYHGSASGLSLASSWTAESDQASAFFGSSVGTAGDVNGDGYTDVIVGADGFDNGFADEGRALVYLGSGTGLQSTAVWTAESDQESARFGWSVGTAGDVNGDGYADVIVGSELFDNGQTDEGRAFVYRGSTSGLSLEPSWTAESDQQNARFGVSVGTAGDVNGDGFSDVIVGAHFYDSGSGLVNTGRAYVYLGSGAGLSPTNGWTAESDQAGAGLGNPVATAGDVNGDGYSDVIVGAYFSDNGQGRASVYYGNGGAGLSLRPQQRRGDDSAPIVPLSWSESPTAFRLAALGRSPFGRGLVKLEWEVKPLGTPLNGSGIQVSSTWLDTGTAGAALNELVSGLTSGTVHHWRVRLRYHQATTPFQSRSRWLTVPVNGWQEGDFRTAPLADLAVSQVEGADPIFFGSASLTYTVNITNSGPDAASVNLTDTVGLVVSAFPSQGNCMWSSGLITCALGTIASGAGASVVVTFTPSTPGSYTNTAEVSVATPGVDPSPANNLSAETTTVLHLWPGDRAWQDADRDGIQDPGEPGLADVFVVLYDGAGNLLDIALTDGTGVYGFPSQTLGATYRIRFFPPAGYVFTTKDQGADDLLDSDADPVTQLTPDFVFGDFQDPFRWDAGFVVICQPPDEPIYIYAVTLSTDGNNYPILHYQDGNQPGQVTGYNVRRSSNRALPPASWPLVATNVIDMDQGLPNKQWVDTSGDIPPGGIWYYNITAWNSVCNAEGPF